MKNIEERILYTPRGFSYIPVTPQENISWGGACICNSCGKQIVKENLNLCFVLSDTYCNACFDDFIKRQKEYTQEDVDHDLNFQKDKDVFWYKQLLDRPILPDADEIIESFSNDEESYN